MDEKDLICADAHCTVRFVSMLHGVCAAQGRFIDLLHDITKLVRADTGLSGAIYTQMTDVEAEVNGIMTYDRKVLPESQLCPFSSRVA